MQIEMARRPASGGSPGSRLDRVLAGRAGAARAGLALLALTIVTRLPSLLNPGPIDDESVYSVVANVMLAGGTPYSDAIERKPPLLFCVYWLVFKLFGSYNWLALHVVALAWVLLTMLGLYALVRPLFDQRAGLVAALVYSALQPWVTAKNLAFNGEVLMNMPLVWAYVLVLRPPRVSGAEIRPFAAGVLVAVASLLKQPAAIAAVPLIVYLASPEGVRPAPVWLRFARARVLAFLAGSLAVLAAATFELWRRRVLGDAFYWSVTNHTVPRVFWLHGFEHTALFALCAWPAILLLATRRPLRHAWRARSAQFYAILGWLVVSWIGAAAGGRFYPHYYIQVIPPLAALAAPCFGRAMPLQAGWQARWLSPRVAGAWLALVVGVSLGVQTFQLTQLRAVPAAAGFVRAASHDRDRMFVWGQATEMYVAADRLPASRYIATFPLTGYIFGGATDGVSTDARIVPGAWANLAHDFAAHPPRFIIDAQAATGDAYPLHRFRLMAAFVARHYRRRAVLGDGIVYERRADAAGAASLRNE